MDKIDLKEYVVLKNDNFIYRDLSPKLQGEQLTGYTSAFDAESIKNSLKNIFLVQKNELAGKPNFGNPLQLELFENFNFFTENTLKAAIKVEIDKYEPRVDLIDVKVNKLEEYNRVIVEIIYSININEGNIQDSIYLPFSANNFTYLSGRETINY
jgi:phage baseplate assembly protein W